MRFNLMVALIFIVLCVPVAHAQIDDFFIFPQVADGVFPDGQSYRSTLMIQNAFSSSAITCTFQLYGMTTRIGNATGSSFPLTIPADGWLQVQTLGAQSFQQGYGTLTCSSFVYATVLYSYFIGGQKMSEAAVFGESPSFSFKLIADQTEGARLGLAIANNSDIARTYDITLKTAANATSGTSSVQVPARSSVARFLDDLIPSSRNQILEATVQAADFSFDTLAVVGIRMTGTVIATIPAN